MIDVFNTTRTQMLFSTKSCVILLFGVPAKSKKEKPKTLHYKIIFLRQDLHDSQDIFYSFVPEEQKNEESAIAEVNTSI